MKTNLSYFVLQFSWQSDGIWNIMYFLTLQSIWLFCSSLDACFLHQLFYVSCLIGFLWNWGCKCFVLTARKWFWQFTSSHPVREGSAGTSSADSYSGNRWTSYRVFWGPEKYFHYLFLNNFCLNGSICIPVLSIWNLMIISILNTNLAVAKALRQAAEGKAVAQAEASEWKRRYELERARNLQMERKGS